MVQWLRALAAFAEDLSSILSTHMVAHNICNSQFQEDLIPLSGFHKHWCTDIHAGKTTIHQNLKKIKSVCVKVKGQLCEADSLLPPLDTGTELITPSLSSTHLALQSYLAGLHPYHSSGVFLNHEILSSNTPRLGLKV